MHFLKLFSDYVPLNSFIQHAAILILQTMCRLRRAAALRVMGQILLTVKRLPVPLDTIPLMVDHAQVFALALHDSFYFTLICCTTHKLFLEPYSPISFDMVENIFYKQTKLIFSAVLIEL